MLVLHGGRVRWLRHHPPSAPSSFLFHAATGLKGSRVFPLIIHASFSPLIPSMNIESPEAIQWVRHSAGLGGRPEFIAHDSAPKEFTVW